MTQKKNMIHFASSNRKWLTRWLMIDVPAVLKSQGTTLQVNGLINHACSIHPIRQQKLIH